MQRGQMPFLLVLFEDTLPEDAWGALCLFFKEAVKISSVFKAQLMGYFLGRKLSVEKAALGFQNQALVNMRNGRFSPLFFYDLVQMAGADVKQPRVIAYQVQIGVMLFDQRLEPV